jgi:hypothetical protein
VAIASQAKYYVAIFLNSFIWQYALRLFDQFHLITADNESSWVVMILLTQFFSGSTGFGFLLTYIRPRYLRYRYRGNSRIKAFGLALSFKSQQQRDQEQKELSGIEIFCSEDAFEASSALCVPSAER